MFANKNKKEEKFNKIYNEYINMVFYIASGFFENQNDKEDAVFETFSKIFSNLDSLTEDEKRNKNFIAVVAKNTCITIKNKQNKIKQIPLENTKEYETSNLSLEEELEEKEALKVYKNALLKLPTEYYEVIYLRFFEELSVSEIAKIVGVSKQNCYQRIHRARKMLSKLIKEEIYE